MVQPQRYLKMFPFLLCTIKLMPDTFTCLSNILECTGVLIPCMQCPRYWKTYTSKPLRYPRIPCSSQGGKVFLVGLARYFMFIIWYCVDCLRDCHAWWHDTWLYQHGGSLWKSKRIKINKIDFQVLVNVKK